MFRNIQKHISPASVLATVALFVALGGVSYAAATIDGKSIKNGTIAGKKLKQQTVTGKQIKKGSLGADRLSAKARASLRGSQGPQGPQGPQGAPGAQGVPGQQGPAGTALAYAQVVDGTPSLQPQRTSGFVSVSRVAVGTYCLEPDPVVAAQAFSSGSPTRPLVASVEYGNTGTATDQLTVAPRGINSGCPDNTFEVHTYRNGAAADNVAFTVIVP